MALKSALYDFTSSRDFYREATTAVGIGMHKDVLLRYVELQALLITPIAPHWADYIWREVLNKVSTSSAIQTASHTNSRLQPESIHFALFPDVPEPSPSLTAALAYLRSTSSNITSAEAGFAKKLAKGKAMGFNPKKPKKITIFVAKKFPSWQEKYIDLVREAFDAVSLSINDKELNAKVGKYGEMKKAMPFVQGLKKRLVQSKEKPEAVFDRQLGFDELQVLTDYAANIKKTTGCKILEIISVEEGGKVGTTVEGEARENLPPSAESAIPGNPTFHFENIPEVDGSA